MFLNAFPSFISLSLLVEVMNSHRMNLFWNYVPKNEYALERPSTRHKGGLRSRLRKGRDAGRKALGKEIGPLKFHIMELNAKI